MESTPESQASDTSIKEKQKETTKYFAVSKGFMGGSFTFVLALVLIGAEAKGVSSWTMDAWHEWIKVVTAVLAALTALLSIYGRVVADKPIRFF